MHMEKTGSKETRQYIIHKLKYIHINETLDNEVTFRNCIYNTVNDVPTIFIVHISNVNTVMKIKGSIYNILYVHMFRLHCTKILNAKDILVSFCDDRGQQIKYCC